VPTRCAGGGCSEHTGDKRSAGVGGARFAVSNRVSADARLARGSARRAPAFVGI
jgi:hypothetical protein